MNKIFKILTAALAAVFLWGCSDRNAESDRQVIAVSTPAVGRVVSEIVGDQAEVIVLLPAGTDPENYEPDMASMKQLSKADAFVSLNTIGFEEKLGNYLTSARPELKQIDLSTGVERLQDGHAHGDPHLLSSPANALTVTANAAQALAALYPDKAEIFSRNTQAFTSKLQDIAKQTSELLADAKGRTFVVTHPSLSYFARDYGLDQLALEQDGKEASPRQLDDRLRQAATRGAVAVFYEQSHSPQQAKQAARELGVEAIPIDFNAADFPDQYLRVAAAIARP